MTVCKPGRGSVWPTSNLHAGILSLKPNFNAFVGAHDVSRPSPIVVDKCSGFCLVIVGR